MNINRREQLSKIEIKQDLEPQLPFPDLDDKNYQEIITHSSAHFSTTIIPLQP